MRVTFSEPVEPASAVAPSSYRFDLPCKVATIQREGAAAVQLTLEGSAPVPPFQFVAEGIADLAAARNRMAGGAVKVNPSPWTVRYDLESEDGGVKCLEDLSGGDNDAGLQGGAAIEPGMGPHGGAALVLDGTGAFAEASADLNLGPGDFSFAVWVYRESPGVILSKGTDFGQPEQWSFGWPMDGVPGSVSLRIKNQFFATAERSVRDRQWTHLAFVRSGKRGFSYVNGMASGGPHDMPDLTPLVNDRPLRIGRREYAANPAYFKGRVSGLTIWPRALSTDEVRREAHR